jgi:hypothetical protein
MAPRSSSTVSSSDSTRANIMSKSQEGDGDTRGEASIIDAETKKANA